MNRRIILNSVILIMLVGHVFFTHNPRLKHSIEEQPALPFLEIKRIALEKRAENRPIKDEKSLHDLLKDINIPNVLIFSNRMVSETSGLAFKLIPAVMKDDQPYRLFKDQKEEHHKPYVVVYGLTEHDCLEWSKSFLKMEQIHLEESYDGFSIATGVNDHDEELLESRMVRFQNADPDHLKTQLSQIKKACQPLSHGMKGRMAIWGL